MSSEQPLNRKRRVLIGIGGLTLAAVLVAYGMAARAGMERSVVGWTERQALPIVACVQPEHNVQGDALRLPARLEAWSKAPINARVSGYLKDWKVDIGSQVQAGEVLAEIDSPELDQQLAQTRAHLRQQEATERLALTTAKRWQDLLVTHSVSRQDVDEKVSNAMAAKADLQAARADYQRLQDLAAYKTIRAPFSGTITARNTDIGQLINADAAGTVALFNIADTRRLRLYVPVPQSYASAIAPGLQVQLTVPEHPTQQFSAHLIGDSTAIDPRSGTLLAQFVTDNPDGALLPGDFAEATVKIAANTKSVNIPSSALIFRAQGTQVAVLDETRHVHMRTVHIDLDLGDRLVIDQGLKSTDQVIDNPPDALKENDLVELAGAGDSHVPNA
ncbi:efflux RND transporter periplasmic adaptor subunit [Pseudomonas sp. RIT-PI-r]|uniref:efflux RND transporter periplasmic adaptor subunit n=1 Tax=Pseudomonas sp. RIT-PI-r TaxID=1699620 RepID=UPI0006D6B0A8|nr:efflux RND transporter periplasmic adaptor subunit [Pseudomonas sp. RIT-PI-r]KPG96314.1 RND transporter MFP subunit [Pseudomonas sp. RIT-PI-r]